MKKLLALLALTCSMSAGIASATVSVNAIDIPDIYFNESQGYELYSSESTDIIQNRYIGRCIGGSVCRTRNYLRLRFDEPRYVKTVTVYAHDDVGSKTKARLRLGNMDKRNGVVDLLYGDRDIKRAGGYVTYQVNKVVTEMFLQSHSESGGTEETYIESVSVNFDTTPPPIPSGADCEWEYFGHTTVPGGATAVVYHPVGECRHYAKEVQYSRFGHQINYR
ncbi:MAG: hypothetical protein COA42_14740 [Alteromonadaceae bacterium]|nr:MAG: hypothetical protein COA42_14740 [Alteromonadaceae bacterium]